MARPARLLALPAILLLVGALYGPVIGYPFLDLDDHYYVVVNPGLRDLSWDGVRFLYLEDQRDFRWFPTSYLSLAVDRALFGLDPRFFHGTNVLLHLANTALVFGLLLVLSRDALVAGVASLLFGIHPLQLESVAWVISRKNVLFLFFFLLSALAYVGYLRARGRAASWSALGASVALFLAAITSKTAAVTLPAVLVLIDHRLAPRRPSSALAFARQTLPSKLVYLPVIALAWVMTERLSQRSPYFADYHLEGFDWVLIAAHNLFFYVAKALVPIRLGVFYPLPNDGAPLLPAHYYVYALLSLALVALCVWSFRRHRELFFGTAWYLATIAPLALLPVVFPDIPILAADRFFYQSSIGLFYLVGVGFRGAWRRAAGRTAARAALAAILAAAVGALFWTAAVQRGVWRGTIPLYEATLRHHPSDAFYYRLALQYANEGNLEQAFRALYDAENARNQVFFGRLCVYQMRIADLYRELGDYAKAAEFLAAAIESTPNALEPADARTPLAYHYLASLWESAGDTARAAEARARAETAAIDPHSYFESLWFTMSPDAARRLLERRVRRAPDDAVAWFYLGQLDQLEGATERAQERVRRAEELGFPPD